MSRDGDETEECAATMEECAAGDEVVECTDVVEPATPAAGAGLGPGSSTLLWPVFFISIKWY